MKTTKPQCAGWISIVGWIIVKITLEFSIKTLKSTLYIMLGCEGGKSLSAKGKIQTCPADGPALGGLSIKYIEVSHSFQVKSELLKSWITKLKSSYCCSYILWKISHHKPPFPGWTPPTHSHPSLRRCFHGTSKLTCTAVEAPGEAPSSPASPSELMTWWSATRKWWLYWVVITRNSW